MKCEIRESLLTDAEAVSALSGQLGYPVPVEVIRERLECLTNDPDHLVVIACAPDGRVVGWMDVGIVLHLQSGTYCEIGGLVVDESARKNGVGRELVAYAEEWAAERNVRRVLVRSNAKRTDAHRFYLRENYELIKTSAVFEKRLSKD